MINEGGGSSVRHLLSAWIHETWNQETPVVSLKPVSAGSGSRTMKRLQLQAASTQPKLKTKVQFHFFDSHDTKLFTFPLSHDTWLSV